MERVILSGYTKKSNKGISVIDLDYCKKDYKKFQVIEEENPSYITLNKEGDLLFSTSSKENGSVAIYRKIDGKYHIYNRIAELGKAPCHLYYDENDRLLYASNYHLGKVHIIGENNSNQWKLINTIEIEDELINENKKESRCHMALKDNENKYLIVVNLGTDSLYVYNVDKNGKHNLKSKLKLEENMGPRHIVFHKNGKIAYLVGELNSQISILSYDNSNGEFSYINSIKIKPDGDLSQNWASAIRLSEDNRFLYVSERGNNTINVFEIKENYSLVKIQTINTKGLVPRDFNFSKSGEYMIIGHQDSDFSSVYGVNKENGILEDYLFNIEASEIISIESL